MSTGFWQLVGRCLSSERWLAAAHAQRLLSEHALADITDQQSFRRVASRLASDVTFLRMEAAHTERGWGF